MVRPFILRRLKSQVLTELSARTDIVIQAEPGQKEGVLYEAQRQLAVAKLTAANGGNPGQRALRILAEITRLRRLCCNPRLVLPNAGIESAKMTAFAELLEELLEGRHKVLVFSQFVDHLTHIVAHLRAKKISYQYLDGQPPGKRAGKKRSRLSVRRG